MALLGADNVVQGDAMAPYATDVYRARCMPRAVVRPGTVADLQAVVRAATGAGLAVVARGGGASYTDGYLPTRSDSVLIDTGRLDRIVEINERDAYVTVEAGVTWKALKEALEPRGLRTPFFGPFSGIAATIGGSMSQHSISHGSGAHGISAQSLIAMDVVLASGELLQTGSSARHSAPFCRWYGPDLGGVFCGDAGALGVKARITLPLLRQRTAFECLSFGFEAFADLAEALRIAALEHLDDENFAIDAAISQGQIARQERVPIGDVVRGILRSAPSKAAALRQLLRMLRAGSRAFATPGYTAHFIVEGVAQQDARIRAQRLRELMPPGAVEIANTIPAVVRGMPFAPLFNTLGPKGERWVPLHGLLPHSRVADFHAAVAALYASHADTMRRLGVWHGGMFTTLGSTAFLYEIALYWPGAPSAYHRAAVPADYLAALPKHADDPAVSAFVERLKGELVALYDRFGAVHFQLGKTYPYAGVLQGQSLALLRAIKRELDPQGLMNPGALGL